MSQSPKLATYKRIILCADGTWQASDIGDKSAPSNVAKLARAIGNNGIDAQGNIVKQIVSYHSGLGAGGLIFENLIYGGIGWGLDGDVRQIYDFISKNYEDGDELFFFGFSRGAFTVRSVASLVCEIGVLSAAHMSRFTEMWEADRENSGGKTFRKSNWYLDHKDALDLTDVRVKVVGVWDTVGALGIPEGPQVRWLKSIGLSIRGYSFHNSKVSKNLDYAFQALAIDEQRLSYSPTLWHKTNDGPAKDLQQCWFAGAHEDIGGLKDGSADVSYSETGYISFAWMVDNLSGMLTFDNEAIEIIIENHSSALNRIQVADGWGCGPIVSNFSGWLGLFRWLVSRQDRTPGVYRKDPGDGTSGVTNEYFHPTVRIRQENIGYNPISLKEYAPTKRRCGGGWEWVSGLGTLPEHVIHPEKTMSIVSKENGSLKYAVQPSLSRLLCPRSILSHLDEDNDMIGVDPSLPRQPRTTNTMMRVFISDISLAKHGIFHNFEMEVDKGQPLSQIIKKVAEKGAKGDLVYQGKSLASVRDRHPADEGLFNDSTIHIIPSEENTRTFREQSSFVEFRHHSEKLKSLKEAADKYNFDYNPHIIEPEEYYKWRTSLEEYVFANSELRMSDGSYDAEENNFDFFGHVDVPAHMLPQSHLALNLWAESQTSPSATAEHQVTGKTLFLSYMKSYLILTRLNKSMNTLVAEGFVSSYFSFLLEIPGKAIAQIVPVEHGFLSKLQEKIEKVVWLLFDEHTSIKTDLRDEKIQDCLQPVINDFFGSLTGTAPSWPNSSPSFMSRLCRLTVLLCDLALLSYVGSHASRFDYRFINKPEICHSFGIQSEAEEDFGFMCDLRRLKCLDQLFGSQPVWVFRLKLPDGIELKEKPFPPDPELSIMTKIEHLADVWGPVHAIRNSKDENQIYHYVLGTGIIRRSDVSEASPHQDVVQCHWEDLSASNKKDTKSIWYKKLYNESPARGPTLLLHDVLLIGMGGFQENSTCIYNQRLFKQDYQDDCTVKWTSPPAWKTEGRGVSLSVSKIIGLGGSVSQRRHPGVSIKDAVMKEWTLMPKKADPEILQRNYGVEVSACIGNARRVPLKSFIQGEAFQKLLRVQFTNLEQKVWRVNLENALNQSDKKGDPEPLHKFWRDHEQDKEEVSDLVTYVLSILEDSGTVGDNLKVCLAVGLGVQVVSMPRQLNEWASILDNTNETAAYIAMTPLCITYSRGLGSSASEKHYSECSHTSTCQSHTMLHFQSSIPTSARISYLRLKPAEKLFRVEEIASDSEGGALVLKPVVPWFYPGPSSRADMREIEFSHEIKNARSIYIYSTVLSNGGMVNDRQMLRAVQSGSDSTLQDSSSQNMLALDEEDGAP